MQKHATPTLAEIGRRTAEIRRGWSATERRRRAALAERCVAILALLTEVPQALRARGPTL